MTKGSLPQPNQAANHAVERCRPWKRLQRDGCDAEVSQSQKQKLFTQHITL
jgi:hypothetical protein